MTFLSALRKMFLLRRLLIIPSLMSSRVLLFTSNVGIGGPKKALSHAHPLTYAFFFFRALDFAEGLAELSAAIDNKGGNGFTQSLLDIGKQSTSKELVSAFQTFPYWSRCATLCLCLRFVCADGEEAPRRCVYDSQGERYPPPLLFPGRCLIFFSLGRVRPRVGRGRSSRFQRRHIALPSITGNLFSSSMPTGTSTA